MVMVRLSLWGCVGWTSAWVCGAPSEEVTVGGQHSAGAAGDPETGEANSHPNSPPKQSAKALDAKMRIYPSRGRRWSRMDGGVVEKRVRRNVLAGKTRAGTRGRFLPCAGAVVWEVVAGFFASGEGVGV